MEFSSYIVLGSLQGILLADQHAGITPWKQLAQRYLWWPGLDKQIDETVKHCNSCQESAKSPASTSPASWSWPGGP